MSLPSTERVSFKKMGSDNAKRPRSAAATSRINRTRDKHYERLAMNDKTGRVNDPNYARKWKKIKAGQKRHKANRKTPLGKALFGGRGSLGGGGSAAEKWLGNAASKQWWTKV